jgi:hypothetical protein
VYLKIWQGFHFSRRLFLRSALALLVGIGFWNGHLQVVARASSIGQNEDGSRFELET